MAARKSARGLRAVELFAGIGGFRRACDALGIETVFANDLDPRACEVYRHRNGPIHKGDLRNCLGNIPEHTLLTAGIPCQPFSAAGKKRGVLDPRGTLFQLVVDVLERHQPSCFVIENVKRLLTMEAGAHFATILGALAELDYELEWRLINARHFGLAQNRQRVVIVGRKGARDETRSVLTTKDDFGGVAAPTLGQVFDKASWKPIEHHGRKFANWGLAARGRFAGLDLPGFAESLPMVRLSSVLERDVAKCFDFTESTRQRIAASEAVHGYVQGVEILYNQGGGARMGYTVFGTGGIAPTLTCTTSRHYERYKVGDRFRRLTNVEYARLQGFPDEYCQGIPIHVQYELYGNAFPPPMAAWVIGKLAEARGTTSDQPCGEPAIASH